MTSAVENITVLFTDLVGSTEIACELGPDAADELRREHFACLRRQVASAGGVEVKNLGDGLMIVFSTASAGLAGAVAMQQAVDRDNRLGGPCLGLRIGVASGEATREDDDYFGDPVIEAARLCAHACGGQILASDLVRATAGRRSPHSFSPLGPLQLKGLPEPTLAFEIGWEPAGEDGGDAVPLPARLTRQPSIGLIGRSEETARLADAFKRAAGGGGREVVLISAEAGMGKTTLAAAAAGTAHAGGACVLLGRCEEDLGAPYGPFVEALGHLVAHAPKELLEAHVRSRGAHLGRLLPGLHDRLGQVPAVPDGDPDAERYLAFGAVAALLGAACARAPVVLVLDDLQWADRPSLQLLRYVVAHTEAMRLLVIGTYRDAELSASHPLTEALAALHRESAVSRLQLRGLDDSAVLSFLRSAAGHDLDEAGVGLAHAVYRETDGNPFFVGEVLRHLAETGAIYQDGKGRWRAPADLDAVPLPDSVRHVIGARVAGLGDAALDVLLLAAVIGRDFDLEVLALVSDRSEDELLAVLDAAASRALVRELADVPGRYSFSHALVRHTLYQDLGATRRSRAHRAVAEALEGLCGDDPGERVGELAHHWSSALQAVDADKAIGYSRRAAEAAMAALAPEDAVRYYAQALQLAEHHRHTDPLLSMDLRIGLGTAQRQAGVAAFRETLLEAADAARRLGASDRLVSAVLANNRGTYSALGLVDRERVAALEAALNSVSDDDTAERALLLATLAVELTWDPLEQALPLAEEAKAVALRLGEPAVFVQVMNLTRQARDVPSTLAQRVQDAEESYRLATQLGDPVALFWAGVHRLMVAEQSGDFEAAAGCLATLRAEAERLKQPVMLYWARLCAAADGLVRGDHEGAEIMATEAFRIADESRQPDGFAYYGAQLLLVRMQQGRLEELLSMLSEVVAANPNVPAYRGALAEAHLEAGQPEEARQLLEAAASTGFSCLPLDPAWSIGMALYADVAIELRHTSAAAKLLEHLTPYHDQIPFNSLIRHEPVAFCLGGLATVLGRYDEAESYFSDAMEICRRGEMSFSEARTQLAIARMRLQRLQGDDLEQAGHVLECALATAVNRGYASLEAKVRALAAAAV